MTDQHKAKVLEVLGCQEDKVWEELMGIAPDEISEAFQPIETLWLAILEKMKTVED